MAGHIYTEYIIINNEQQTCVDYKPQTTLTLSGVTFYTLIYRKSTGGYGLVLLQVIASCGVLTMMSTLTHICVVAPVGCDSCQLHGHETVVCSNSNVGRKLAGGLPSSVELGFSHVPILILQKMCFSLVWFPLLSLTSCWTLDVTEDAS